MLQTLPDPEEGGIRFLKNIDNKEWHPRRLKSTSSPLRES